MLRSKLIGLLALLSSKALAALTAEELETRSPIAGYKMVEPEWKIEINPGEFVNLKGNINQVRSQALELNPRWEDNEGKESVSSNPEKRSPVWANIVCGPGPNNFEWASSMPLRMEAIPALRKWKGLPVLHWRTCAAVMCWQGNNIILCNDNDGELTLQGWIDVADAAQRILDSCTLPKWGVAGQQFAQGNWNVVVTKSYFGLPCMNK